MKLYRVIHIKKPLYETEEGDMVGVYNQEINRAIKNRQYILIRSKNGEQVFMPKWIQKNCPIIEKVFLRPNDPMKLYKIFVKKKKSKEEELKELAKMGIFG